MSPQQGAKSNDWGRTNVATPMMSPEKMTPRRDRSDAIHAASVSRAAVTPSVISAGVYRTIPGCSATASPAARAHRGRVAARANRYAASAPAAPSTALSHAPTAGKAAGNGVPPAQPASRYDSASKAGYPTG